MATTSMKLITSAMLNELVTQAGASQRLRCNYNVHEEPSDPIQRLFIAACLKSYFRPHRHPGKKEMAIVLRGLFDVITFDNMGRVSQRVPVGPAAAVNGLEIPADVWHTWVPLDDQSVFFEVKPGPYDPSTVVEFAGWSPAEGTAGVPAFYEKLLAVNVGETIS
ncbi:MAG: cupin fold metalloprotein, WbuC family [Deltaproteobacteria bacterium HGW-Deltaproteobacteria-12]|jgi:cupin fold WbuC family metalloprotein|nr:MAG: cupin fold metalloprotein, WbuC family [Deltaproteobacteria bacterium HGW-Deltaproteobacteria-12]